MKIIRRTALLFLCLVLSACSADTGRQILYPVEPSGSTTDLEYISNLGTEKYNLLLEVWRGEGSYPAYPSFYGGCYEADNKDLILMVTSLDQEVIDYFGNLIDLEHVGFSPVEHSFQELLDAKAVISDLVSSGAFGEEITSQFTGVGISEPENSVNIYLATENLWAARGPIEMVYAQHSDSPCPLRFFSLYPDNWIIF